MTQETDTTKERSWLSKARAQTVIKNLNKKHINALYASNRNEALSLILGMVPDDVTVVRGDSITLEQIDIIPTLTRRGKNRITDPFEKDSNGQLLYPYTSEQALNMYREAFSADVFLAGTNAITLDGKLVNTDGAGNRVAPMIFGPKKVIIAAGVNKIVGDVDEARKRIRDICAPLDVERYILKHGQKEYETCYTVIIEAAAITEHNRINVILIGEELGY
jgi:hypothetical protein